MTRTMDEKLDVARLALGEASGMIEACRGVLMEGFSGEDKTLMIQTMAVTAEALGSIKWKLGEAERATMKGAAA